MRTAYEYLSYPDVDFGSLTKAWPELANVSRESAELLEAEALYATYVDRQKAEIDAFNEDANFELPPDLDYKMISGLSNEITQKLQQKKPETIGHAARIDGVTPGALVLVMAHVKKSKASKKLAS
jgi:tRNA uridine 5-carboxymethylaminomethyl modification enzyme